MTEKELLLRKQAAIRKYIKQNKDTLPEWWQDKGTNVCINGIVCMLARDKYTNKEIAECYECPPFIVRYIADVYHDMINRLRKERDQINYEFDGRYKKVPISMFDERGVCSLVGRILSKRCEVEDGE